MRRKERCGRLWSARISTSKQVAQELWKMRKNTKPSKAIGLAITASGHAAAPPSRVMNSRRLIGLALGQGQHPTKIHRVASQQYCRAHVRVGSLSTESS